MVSNGPQRLWTFIPYQLIYMELGSLQNLEMGIENFSLNLDLVTSKLAYSEQRLFYACICFLQTLHHLRFIFVMQESEFSFHEALFKNFFFFFTCLFLSFKITCIDIIKQEKNINKTRAFIRSRKVRESNSNHKGEKELSKIINFMF